MEVIAMGLVIIFNLNILDYKKANIIQEITVCGDFFVKIQIIIRQILSWHPIR